MPRRRPVTSGWTREGVSARVSGACHRSLSPERKGRSGGVFLVIVGGLQNPVQRFNSARRLEYKCWSRALSVRSRAGSGRTKFERRSCGRPRGKTRGKSSALLSSFLPGSVLSPDLCAWKRRIRDRGGVDFSMSEGAAALDRARRAGTSVGGDANSEEGGVGLHGRDAVFEGTLR
jgi:hypothetical protein